jgi:hypothetical protein
MTRRCPNRDELMQLLDGEITENRATQLREHVDGCSSCREQLSRERQLLADIGAPRPELPSSALVSRIMQGAADMPTRPTWRTKALRAGLVAAACSALAVLLLGGLGRGNRFDTEFHSRGGAHVGLSRYVSATLVRADRGLQRLEAGARVAPDTTYGLTYRNLKGGPVYLLCFAVDAKQEIHWLYPAYLDPQQDPPALELAAAAAEVVLPESVMLEQPAPGHLRFISILSTKAERVSSIERLAPGQLQTAALRQRFPAAVVNELSVQVAASP